MFMIIELPLLKGKRNLRNKVNGKLKMKKDKQMLNLKDNKENMKKKC